MANRCDHIQPKTIDKIFDFLRKSPSASLLLDEFGPLYQKGDIPILDLDFDAWQRVSSGTVHDLSLEAVFHFDGKQKAIYLEEGHPFYRTAIHLIHEIVHALDQDYLDSYRKLEPYMDLANEDIGADMWKVAQQRTYRAEEKAHGVQAKVVGELMNVDPTFEKYVLEQRQTDPDFSMPPSERYLTETYGLEAV